MMLSGAMASVVASSILRNHDAVDAVTGEPLFPAWLASIGRSLEAANLSEAVPWHLLSGLLAAMFIGGLLAAFHAWLSIQFKVDQIISGTVINIFAAGMTSFLSQRFLQPIQTLNSGGTFKTLPIPGLSHFSSPCRRPGQKGSMSPCRRANWKQLTLTRAGTICRDLLSCLRLQNGP
jgi:ABC-type uncharacterized transport system permease subunit